MTGAVVVRTAGPTIVVVDRRPAVVRVATPAPTVVAVTRRPAEVMRIVERGRPGPQGPGVDPVTVAQQVAALVAAELASRPAFVHVQDQPSASWHFDHPLGRLPAVELWTIDGRRFRTDVYATAHDVSVQFPMPMVGTVVCL